MDNLSVLNLFSTQASVELPKVTDNGRGEFENVFKKYLERSDDRKPLKTDTAQQEQKSVKAEEPETPEEVIDNLDIPEDQKAELKRMLEEAETEEDISLFLDELMVLAEDGAEEVLSQMAMAVLTTENRSPKESMILEQSLDQIAAIQSKASNQPQLTLVKNDSAQTEVSDDNPDKGAKKELVMNANQQQKQGEIPAELKAKIAEVVVSQEKPTETIDNGFTVKQELSDKVIKAEIKVEGPKDIMKFAELIELAKSQKANKLNIQLHPQELGKMTIELTEQAGRVSGKVTFESETARNLFTNNIEGLKQQLADKGVVVENLEFLFKDDEHHEFAGWEGREGKKSGNGISVNFDDEEESEGDTEEADGIYA